ncbi:hypothetical protein Cni_G09573 [Canna indica]|uniref:Late embryogenesis abundant protein LEA-2 subgroup domain-containing protein n=1 Tax=Canna indica TaxID=4628 RepID=A0AAQ3K4K2_9LILI|nr:hypothetical protein Cni_G09573 [Canna indica]
MVSRRSSCCLYLYNLVLSVGSTVFIWWLIYQPRLPRLSLHDGTLAFFDLSENSTALHYNLTVGLAVRNPNKRVGFVYGALDAAVSYHGAQLESAPLPPFYQPRKNTTVLRVPFGGRAGNIDRATAAVFAMEKSQGLFEFDVKLQAKMRMKLSYLKIGQFHPKFACKVRIQLPTHGELATAAINTTVCVR